MIDCLLYQPGISCYSNRLQGVILVWKGLKYKNVFERKDDNQDPKKKNKRKIKGEGVVSKECVMQ